MIPAEAIERARDADILAAAQSLGAVLRRISRGEFVGPCPTCGGADRFSVNVGKQVWNCRGCQRGGDVIGLVRHLQGGTFADAVATLAGAADGARRSSRQGRLSPDDEIKRAQRFASGIWSLAQPIEGTLAERYLADIRGIDLAQIPEIDDVLRFEPACPFDAGNQAACLIALIRDIITDRPIGIQRTALRPDAQKIGRMGLGPKAGGAIKLWPDDAVTMGLVVGEGLETVAAAATRIEHKGTLLQPAWALVDRGNLANFAPLPGIEALTILVDADVKGDGQKAAAACAERWLEAGRDVDRLEPKELGTDFNDIARREKTP